MPDTFAVTSNDEVPLWTAPRLAKKLSIHHLTLLKKVQDRRGKFEIPLGAFKLGNGWRWRDEDVQAYLLKQSGAQPSNPPAQPHIQPPIKRGPGRPRKQPATDLLAGGAV